MKFSLRNIALSFQFLRFSGFERGKSNKISDNKKLSSK